MDALNYGLLAFGSLFAILSPFATVPMFLALTEDDEEEARISMARRACVIALVVLLAFGTLGAAILEVFRISVPALQIAGGLVILKIGLEMLTGDRGRLTPEERAEARAKEDVAVTPLAIPVLCGPGTITTGMLLGSAAAHWIDYVVLAFVATAIYGITFCLLFLAVRYSAFVGQITLRVIGRIMGLLVAAIAVQFILDGTRDVLPTLLAS